MSHARLRFVPLAVLLVVLLAVPAQADESPILDRPLPVFDLSHSLQGPAWTHADLAGSIVVLDLFQIGCPACMSNSLPHAQRLFERFAGDERVRVVAVATAFEKAEYPWMADEDQIRRTLKQKGWTFPVMRDTDAEQIVRTLTLKGRTGTPMTLVVDTEGVVRWHAFNGTEATAQSVDETVERLLESFYVPAIPDLDAKLSAYAKGKYGTAYKAAQRIVESEEAPDALRVQAELVLANLDAGVLRLTAESVARRERGFPAAAQEKLESAVKVFRGVPSAKDADAALRALKGDSGFRRELKAEKDLSKILAKLADPDAKRAALAKKLDKLTAAYGETPVGRRIQAALVRARE